MGFSDAKVTKALKVTKNAGLQPAMDWLFEHAEDPDTEMADAPSSAATKASDEQEDGEITAAQQTANSLVCDDCGKLFRDSARAELHAAKSGHINFSESTQAIKPLTDEEKKQKLVELQAKLAAKREEKRALELEETKEKEKIRRVTAKEIAEGREKHKELEMKKAFEEKKREQAADKEAKARIKALLEQDKLDRQKQRDAAKLAAQGIKPAPEPQQPLRPAVIATPTGEYDTTRLQLRPSDGPALVQTFQATQTLADVYEWVATQRGAGFKLVQTFPRKVLDVSVDGSKTLKQLNLVPSAALAIQ
ncbi:hypothetical protein SmJEL517_g02280 [Synchytrium microbalum]|uniref:UBX domain-containing protein n=1 Tax=Synchytrium microbalum TaxID=1806994 RepID=A0A507CBE7_9FUNG|nr:uncharacterized protein SmJEL517_g02280 [Synchytrium microbalum]TPX35326.1 hypothetical protein SmJEL517_g02280 [Synchytrium microbalum]